MTGSSVRLSKTGAFDNTSRKEYEPLGQEVLPNEPALDDQDVGAAIARPFIADEPERKCRVAEGIGTNFFELPINCQRAQLQDLSSSLKDLLSAKTENNPNRMTFNDSPQMDFNYSAVGEMMSIALLSTSKNKKNKEKKKGDDGKIYGDANGVSYVTVRAENDFDGLSAEFGATVNLSFLYAEGALEKGLSAANKVIDSKDCAALFTNIKLENLGFSKPSELLDFYVKNNFLVSGNSYRVRNPKNPTKINPEKFGSGDIGAVTIGGMNLYKNSKGLLTTASEITINKFGFFYLSGNDSKGRFVGSVSGSGFQGLDLDQIRGAVIIHELLHTLGDIPDDGEQLHDDGKQSKANSELVRKSCFGK